MREPFVWSAFVAGRVNKVDEQSGIIPAAYRVPTFHGSWKVLQSPEKWRKKNQSLKSPEIRHWSWKSPEKVFIFDHSGAEKSINSSTSIYGRRFKTPQCLHLSSHYCVTNTTINLFYKLICHRFRSGWLQNRIYNILVHPKHNNNGLFDLAATGGHTKAFR